jgi:ketosteroid isomerase-like protein
MKKILFSSAFAVFMLAACQSGSNQTAAAGNANDSTAAVAAINKADSLWDDQSAHNSVQGWLSFYSDDAIILPPGEKICTDKASREAVIKAYFALPAASMRFQATKTEVSKAGDLGYSSGAYQFSYKDSTGKVIRETGKFNEIWKKQADGSYKCILDTWNADPATK